MSPLERMLRSFQAQLAGMQHAVAGALEQLEADRKDPRDHAGAETFDDNDGDASIAPKQNGARRRAKTTAAR